MQTELARTHKRKHESTARANARSITKWLERITLAPFWIKCLMVGMAARTLVSSVMFWLSSRGTLRSALTNTLFPFKAGPVKSPTLFLAMDTTPLLPFPLKDRSLDATCAAKNGSAAANPRRRRPEERRPEEGRRRRAEREAEDEDEDDEEEEERRENVVGAAADAIYFP